MTLALVLLLATSSALADPPRAERSTPKDEPQPAETVISVPCGTYDYRDVIKKSGTASNWIRYTPEKPRCATIRGGSTPPGRSHYILDNFLIVASASSGPGASGVAIASDHVQIRNSEVRGRADVHTGDNGCREAGIAQGTGIYGNGSNVTVEGNDIHGFDMGLELGAAVKNWVIRDNYIHHTYNGFGWNNAKGPLLFDNNVLWDVPNHIMEMGNNGALDPGTSLTVSNNIIAVGQEGWEGYTGRGVHILNNTFFGPALSSPCAAPQSGIEFQQPAGLADHAYPFVIKNNIVYTHQASFPYFMGFFHGQLPAILQASDHNFLYRPEFPGEARFVDLGPTRLTLGEWRTRYGHDVHTIVGKDPRFANPVGLPAPATIEEARARLKPAPGSPACTAGDGGTHVGAVPCGGSPGKPLGD